MNEELKGRSVRTLAWLGDAEFELEVRRRIALRGDHPLDRLDLIKAEVVRATTQATLLEAIADELEDREQSVVRRARNAQTGGGRHRADLRAYRAATGLEALVAFWACDGSEGRQRFETVLVPRLEAQIDASFERLLARPKRG